MAATGRGALSETSRHWIDAMILEKRTMMTTLGATRPLAS
jgi:hypothetical protein